jgi:8-oxo-dGTP pyrophosphatase MutT (NUDIX family)
VDGVEVFVMRRKSSMAFAPRMYVFPGGAVEPGDQHVALAGGWDLEAAAAQFFTDNPRGVIAAAARETFEECGVLLAATADGGSVDADESLKRDRMDLVSDSVTFAEILERRGLAVDDASLVSLAHWVTPENEPRRFDARFFVAALPAGQMTYEVDGEADRTAWLRPVDALQAWHAGTLSMWIPTASTMRLLTEGSTAAEVIENARQRKVVPVRPHEVPGPDGELAWHLVHDRTLEVLEPMDPKDMRSEAAAESRGSQEGNAQ